MEGGIFVVREDGRMSVLKKGAYDAEAVLQRLLADYPSLLAGEQINPDEPRRWLLISREFPVPDPEDGSARWSLDHLFVDQEAVPTLVEVKRSSDTRIRREVIAQMLDYAANSALWRIEDLIGAYVKTCDDDGVSADERLAEFLAAERSPEDFWQRVKSNLGAAQLRLLFVADEIPVQLQSIVEFLNNQMSSTQVLAIAVPQYMGDDGLTAYVPRLLGQTAQGQLRRAITAKPSTSASRIPMDEQSVAGCLEQLNHNPHIGNSREALTEFVREFAGMAMDLQANGRAEVSYRPNPIGGDKAAMRLEVKIKGSKAVRVVSCECAPKGEDGVSLFWSFRDLLERSTDDPVTTEHIRKLRDSVYAAISTEEIRQDIKNRVEGTEPGKERTPLHWLVANKRPGVIQDIKVFCEAVGGMSLT